MSPWTALSGILQKGMILMALVVSITSCAAPTDGGKTTPPLVNSNDADVYKMKETSVIQIPYGLADPGGKFAYINGPQGLIYYLDLGSGETQAMSDFPGRPLVIYDEALVGWTPTDEMPNAIRLFAVVPQRDVLSTAWEQKIELPPWVDVNPPEADLFRLQAETQDDEVVITWEAHSRYTGGAPPPPGVEADETRDGRGEIHIDPQTGAVLSQEHEDLIPRTAQPALELPTNWRVVPYLQGEMWATHPWSFTSGEAFLVRTAEEREILLVRRTPGSGERLIETFLSENPEAVATVTPDGMYVFIHEPGSAQPSWLVYSVETGEMIAKLPFELGTQGVSVVDDNVLYLVIEELDQTRRSSLHSRDLNTGEWMWFFTLDEEAVTTPPPPPP